MFIHIKLDSYFIKKKKILSNILLNIPLNSIWGVIGSNGAGKTTLFSLLSKGLVSPSLTFSHPFQDHEVAFLKSDPLPLYDYLTVQEQCLFILNLFNPEKTHSALLDILSEYNEALELASLYQIPIWALSKGQKQKVALAVIFMSNPKIVLLDEPFNGLDPHAFLLIEKFLLAKKSSCTILISSHYIEGLERLTNDLCLLENGTCIFASWKSFQKEQQQENHAQKNSLLGFFGHSRQNPLSSSGESFQ